MIFRKSQRRTLKELTPIYDFVNHDFLPAHFARQNDARAIRQLTKLRERFKKNEREHKSA